MTRLRLETARTLALDIALADVVSAMQERGVQVLLIKGPGLARWLYDDWRERSYRDIDLLVAPGQQQAAEQTLSELGFHRMLAGARASELPQHADPWVRAGSRPGLVDLHRTLYWFRTAHPDAVWRQLSDGAEFIEVAGAQVGVPRAAICALIVALHAAQHGRGEVRPLRDLVRALEVASPAQWRAAARVARELDAVAALAAGLRMAPAGAAVADRLGLPAEVPAHVRVCVEEAPTTTAGFVRLTGARTMRARIALVASEVVPTPAFMRVWQPLAARGRTGLILAYAWRPLWLAVKAPRGLTAWRGARREDRRESGGPVGATESLRRAWWAWRALRACRAQLRESGLEGVRLPRPPRTASAGERGLGRALRISSATCLERALVRQAWYASRNESRQLIVGVTAPGSDFRAHAWLEGDGDDTSEFTELVRQPPGPAVRLPSQ